MRNTDSVETKIASRRIINIVAIFFMFYVATLFFMIKNRLLLDEIIISSVLDLIVIGVLVICLIRRRTARLQNNPADTYGLLAVVIAISWVILIAASWLPECFVPIAIIVYMLFAVLDELGSMCLCVYFCLAFAMFESKNIYIMYSYLCAVIVNAMLADYMKKNPDRFKLFVITLAGGVNLFLPLGFSYLAYHYVGIKILIFCIVHMAFTVFAIVFVFPYLISIDEESKWAAYEDILMDDYPLVQDMRSHSQAEYLHGRRVSKLAAKCAHEIGAGELLCACGGMYYRLNILVGGAKIKGAVELASEHCFPPDVIEIIGEYEGRERLPQTRESAIVHMVDGLVTKIELLDAQMMSSDWNQDMLIYQTLNDFSNSGIYDESNLSMNQFLRVRELLVREGIIL